MTDLGGNCNHLHFENFVCLIGRCGCSTVSLTKFFDSGAQIAERLVHRSYYLLIRVRFLRVLKLLTKFLDFWDFFPLIFRIVVRVFSNSYFHMRTLYFND